MTRRQTRKREPTIALINVVFLMLVFFMVAGTLSQPLPRNVTLPVVADLDHANLPDALVVHSDGQISHKGAEIADVAGWARTQDAMQALRIIPDKDAPARAVLALAARLRVQNGAKIRIVTERALQ
ncbi:MAG: biopolymer transporter ExbD [Rhodobacteraceae bacterium]|nr:biopolymer transporter ExbD [Paracoccaceae bacterium]